MFEAFVYHMHEGPNDDITDRVGSYDKIDRRYHGYSIASTTNSVMLEMITPITEIPIIFSRLSPKVVNGISWPRRMGLTLLLVPRSIFYPDVQYRRST